MPNIVNDWMQPAGSMPHALIYAAGYLWIGCETEPGAVIRMDPANPGAYSWIQFPQDGKHYWVMDLLYIPSKGKIYALFGLVQSNAAHETTVAEIDPVTLAWTDVIEDFTYNTEQGSFTADATYLYIIERAFFSAYGYIHRYKLSDWSADGNLNLNLGLPHCCRYDSVTNKIYITGSGVSSNDYWIVVRVDPVTFTVEQGAAGSFGLFEVLTDDLAMTAEYLWVGSEKSGNVVRVKKSDLSQTVIALPVGTSIYCLYNDGTWIWVSFKGGPPGQLARIDPTTLAYTMYQFPDARQISPNEIWGNVEVAGQPATKLFFTFYIATSFVSAASIGGAPPALSILPTAVDGTQGQYLTRSLNASGGAPPNAFHVTGGSMPAGLALATNGALSGTPTVTGTFTFQVTVSDSSANTATAEMTATIAPPAPPSLAIHAPSLDGTVGIAFNRQFTADGGVAPYTFSVTAGSLPPGLMLNDPMSLLWNGYLHGVTLAPGTYHFTVTATDSGGQSSSVDVTSIIDIIAPTIALRSPAVDGRVGVAYNSLFTAEGGYPPYSFAISSGQPPGLTFYSNGLLGGVPTAEGTYQFTVTVLDAQSNAASTTVQAVIAPASQAPPPTLALLSPSSFGGRVGIVYRVVFGATGGFPPYSYEVTDGSLPPGLNLSNSGILTGVPSSPGLYDFTVTVTDTHYATNAASFQAPIDPGQGTGAGAGGGLPDGLSIDDDGVISGTPTQVGRFVFTIRVTDSGSSPDQIEEVTCSITILGIDCGSPPAGSLGKHYAHQIEISGLPPGQYAASAIGLPPGLQMDDTGLISGTPTRLGSFFFTVTVCDFDSPPSCMAVACFINVVEVFSVPQESFWVMDIADRYNNQIVNSIPLLPGAWPGGNILAAFGHLGIGSAFIINQNGGVTDRPDPSDLGTGFCLLWDSNDSYGQSTPVLIPLTNQPNHRLVVSLPINGASVQLNLKLYYNACGGGS